MSAKNTSGIPEDNDKEKGKKMDFEFIEESDIESVKRGRKAIVIPELVEFLTKAKVGQIVKVAKFALGTEFNPTKDMTLDQVAQLVLAKKNAKATASATLRSQAKASGWAKVAIIWDVNNVPFLKKIS
jgi:uncharacterized protein YfiM (DUF2279 family)